MRLTYKKKSKTVKEKTLEQLRFLRMKLEEEHPELMERLTREIKAQPIYTELAALPLPSSEDRAPPEPVNADGDYIIDRRKNLETMLLFLKNHRGSSEFEKELKSLLLSLSAAGQ